MAFQSETFAEARARMTAQLNRFSEQFHTELNALAGGAACTYVSALAGAALGATGATVAALSVPADEPSLEADQLARVATGLLDGAIAAAAWEGALRQPRARARSALQGPPCSPFDPPGGSLSRVHGPKLPTVSKLVSYVVKAKQVTEFVRLLDGVEGDERAKTKPSQLVLRRIEFARRKIKNRSLSSALAWARWHP